MSRSKIAIIGNSGAGKTAILTKLGRRPEAADMDYHFATGKVPDDYRKVLAWILDGTPGEDVLAISTHINTLTEMREHKRYNHDLNLFGRILFVYLYNPYCSKRREYLEMDRGQGGRRTSDHIIKVLDNHEVVDYACRSLADVTINTGDMVLKEAASIIGFLRDAMILRREPSP